MHMMKLTIRPTKRPSVSMTVPEMRTTVLSGSLGELEYVGFALTGLNEPVQMKMLVGDVPVEPPADRRPQVTHSKASGFGFQWPPWIYLERWAGACTISFAEADNTDNVLCRLEVLVLPAKVTVAELNQLLEELASVEIGLIVDVYSKTSGVATGSKKWVGVAPELFLTKAEQALATVGAVLPALRRRPHTTDRTHLGQEYPLSAHPLTPDQLQWLVRRPAGLTEAALGVPDSFRLAGRSLVVTRVPAAETMPDLNTYEHRALRWFLSRLRRGFLALRARALEEHAIRRNATHHWWEETDAPRLAPLLERAQRCKEHARTIETWLRREPVLAAAGPFTPPVRSSAPFQRLPAYRRLYGAMRTFSELGEFRFAGPGERYKFQNLSQLFEYWASLRVLWHLASRYELAGGDLADVIDTERFVLTMKSGFCARFRTGDGRWIRYRYEPAYASLGTPGAKFGRLAKNEHPWRPDVAFEVCQTANQQIPDFLMVFDVKYKRKDQEPVLADLERTASKYMTTIGRFDTYEQLVKHSWLIYPSDRSSPWTEFPIFDSHPPKAMRTMGFVPVLPGAVGVLERTLDRLLELEGLLPKK